MAGTEAIVLTPEVAEIYIVQPSSPTETLRPQESTEVVLIDNQESVDDSPAIILEPIPVEARAGRTWRSNTLISRRRPKISPIRRH